MLYCSYYRPKRSFGQGNIFTPVCHSFCSQGGGFSLPDPPFLVWRTPPPLGWRTPPGGDIPPLDGEPPPPGSRLRHTVYDWPVCILLECILVLLLAFNTEKYNVCFLIENIIYFKQNPHWHCLKAHKKLLCYQLLIHA